MVPKQSLVEQSTILEKTEPRGPYIHAVEYVSAWVRRKRREQISLETSIKKHLKFCHEKPMPENVKIHE